MTSIVHIVDEDPSVRESTSLLLDRHGYATRNYASGVELLRTSCVEGCVLLDLRTREAPGLQVLEQLAQYGSAIPVIILTGHGEVITAVQALRLGVVDFIHKPYEEHELIAAIERAVAGLGPDDRRAEAEADAVERLRRLSPRELQVLRGLVGGMTNKEIARRLDLSPRTVEMHRATMMADLDVGTAAEAIRIAFAADLAPLGEEAWDEARGAPFLTKGPAGRERPAGGPEQRALARYLPPVTDVLEASTDCVLLLDAEFNVTYMNRNASGAGDGVARIGGHVWTVFPAGREAQAWEQLERAQVEKVTVAFEFYAREIGRWYKVSARPIPTGLLLSYRDISLDRAAEMAIRQNEERLRFALEASGDGAWDWDVAQGRIFMSRRFVERLGYGDAPLAVGVADLCRLVHPADRLALKRQLRELLAGRDESFMCEYRIRARDGAWRWNLDRGRVISADAAGDGASRIVGTSTDISAIKAGEEAASAANARFRQAVESAGAGLWDCDAGLQRIRLCPRSRELFGLPRDGAEDVEFECWSRTIHPLDRGPTLDALRLALCSTMLFSARFRAVLPDGRTRWIQATGKAVAAEDGAPGRLAGLSFEYSGPDRGSRTGRRQSDMLNLGRIGAMGTIASALAEELNRIAVTLEPAEQVEPRPRAARAGKADGPRQARALAEEAPLAAAG